MDTAREALIAFIASLNKTQLGLLSSVLAEWEGDGDTLIDISGEYVDLSQKLHESLASYRANVVGDYSALVNIETIDPSLMGNQA